MSKIFIDTNILVYAADRADSIKQNRSRELIRRLQKEDNGVISTQILQEFYVTGVKKLHMDPIVVKSVVHTLQRFETIVIDGLLVEEAIDCSILNRLSYWDAMVVVSAEKAHCDRLWTEDLNHGQIIRGVRIENPFYEQDEEVHEPLTGDYNS